MLAHLNKLTSRLTHVLENAMTHTLFLGRKEVEVEDLFWSLTQAQGSMAREVLNKSGLRLPAVSVQTNQLLSEPAKKNDKERQVLEEKKITFSPLVKRMIEKSVSLAADLQQPYVGTEHLLLALLDLNYPAVDKILVTHKIDKKKVIEQLKVVFQATSNFGGMIQVVHQVSKAMVANGLDKIELSKDDLDLLDYEINERERETEQEVLFKEKRVKQGLGIKERRAEKKAKRKTWLLEHFAHNLCDEKNQKNIDPVIGREREIQRVIQILCRRTKNNPVLLGEPGVGKTAIVEGLAKKIMQGDVPDILLNKEIYSLDLNLMLAGAMMRGEFEARLKQVMSEVKTNPDIIIFIDEIHNVVGAGAVSGAMDAANILKPALARGELRCIGATTYEEYKRHIEEDAALERRFQPVQVTEPSLTEAIEILKGIKENYEKYHRVKISEAALEAAVELSVKYLPEKFLPDKAIDLIDEAAARVKVRSEIVNEDLRECKLLEAKIETISNQKQEQVRLENYPLALKLKQEEEKLQQELWQLEDKISLKLEDKWLGKVSAEDIAHLVSEITKVPLENLIISNKDEVLNLEKVMAESIIGQDEILKELAFYLKRARAGLAGQERPLGSFMFLGPSGVGKTETAKVLAGQIFAGRGKKSALIRLDMSEFAEGFNISRLIGSPAGYVGYKEGGRLTEAVRRNPYSVVLFDEIEKAHPEVFNVLLQILDNGTLSDAAGKRVNFKNTVIILTSNLGLKSFNQASLGFAADGINNEKEERKFEELKADILKEIKEKFRPEFLNRLDKILIFKPLDLKSVEEIVALQLEDLASRLRTKKIKLTATKTLIAGLAKLAYSPESGARNVRRFVEEKIENELAEKMLSGEVKVGEEVKISWKKNKVGFRVEEIRN